jgi:hypothetical protein
VSTPEARHSQNISARPDIGIVAFDSQVPINCGQAVYMSAVAELVPAVDLDRCLDVYSRSSQNRGGSPWSRDDVGPAARLRLYRATASLYGIERVAGVMGHLRLAICADRRRGEMTPVRALGRAPEHLDEWLA